MEDTLRAKQLRQWRQTSCSLNPCCNGRYSQRVPQFSIRKIKGVLILVVMEDTLREYIDLVSVNPVCLNPCCNGRYSQRNYIISENTLLSVLILVVMEDTLREASGGWT